MASAAPSRPVGRGPFLRLPLFEGPLDLLLHLCRRHELPLAQLPIAEVTGQFLAYLEVLDELSLEVAGEFVETAALLCLLKSREMLPALPVEEDEEDADDLRADLVRRLLEYKSFRGAADTLELLPRLDRDFFVRPAAQLAPDDDAEAPLDCDLVDLLGALRDLLEKGRQRAAVHQIEAPPLPLADRMAEVLAGILAGGPVLLAALVGDRGGRAYIVVTFLAVLHLAAERRVRLVQEEPQGPIRVEAA
jgi:segregation and condensation protein A